MKLAQSRGAKTSSKQRKTLRAHHKPHHAIHTTTKQTHHNPSSHIQNSILTPTTTTPASHRAHKKKHRQPSSFLPTSQHAPFSTQTSTTSTPPNDTTTHDISTFNILDTVPMVPRREADPYSLARRMMTYWFQDYERGQMVSDECRQKWLIGHPLLDKYMVYEFSADFEAYREEKLSAQPGPYADLERHPLGSMSLAVLAHHYPRAQLRLLKLENNGILTPDMVVGSFLGPTGRLAQDAFMENVYNGIQTLHPLRYDVIERVHYFLPLLSIENLNTQKVAVARISDLVDEAPRMHRPFLTAVKEFALAHLDVIQQFGRFPQRNQLMGRESTAKEKEWLRLHASHWEQHLVYDYLPDSMFDENGNIIQTGLTTQQKQQEKDKKSYMGYAQFLHTMQLNKQEQKTQDEKAGLEAELAFKPKNPGAWAL